MSSPRDVRQWIVARRRQEDYVSPRVECHLPEALDSELVCRLVVNPAAMCIMSADAVAVLGGPTELRALVRGVLQREADPEGDSRRAWDVVWRMLLDMLLRGPPALPEGTVIDVAAEVRRFIPQDHAQVSRLYPRGEAWKANREGSLEVFSELWARLLVQGGGQWVHLSSKDNDAHAEVQLAEIISHSQQKIRSATVYLNASPCSACSDALLGLLESNPGLQLSLRFGSLFAHHGPNHREGLLRLSRRGVRLTVFTSRDWELVADKQRQCVDSSEEPADQGSESRKRSAPEDHNNHDNGGDGDHSKRQRVS